jgi:transcriptional regulator with XRE-family HTH domain/predicted negative regulator of RcsB-dependent stress response
LPRQTNVHLDDPTLVGRRIRDARQRAGLRLSDLAFPGCSVGYLSHIERGNRTPSLQVLRELAGRLGVSESWLAMGTAAHVEELDPLAEAEAALRFDDLVEAERLFSDAASKATDVRVRARARAGLGQLAFRNDDAEAALIELEAALALDARLEEDDGFADTLGRVYGHVGELETAAALFRRRRTAARATGDTVSALRFSVLLANALIDLNAFSEASQVLGEVLAETSDDDPLLLARLYWSQSRLHSAKNEPAAAARYARKALRILEATEFTQYRSRAHHLLAFVELDRGNADRALELIATGRELARCGGTPYDLAKFDLEEARALGQLGRLEESGQLLGRASSELAHHHPVDLGRCYAELATLSVDAGSNERGRELYELALEYLHHTPNRWLASTYTRLGELLEVMGDRDGAFEAYKRAAGAAASADQEAAR